MVPVKVLYASVSNGETGDGSSGSWKSSSVILPIEDADVLPEMEPHASSERANFGRILVAMSVSRLERTSATWLSTAIRWLMTA